MTGPTPRWAVVAAVVVVGALASATPAAGRQASPDRVGSTDEDPTYPPCVAGDNPKVVYQWSDAPIQAVAAIGPGRVRVTTTGAPCRPARTSDLFVLLAGTATAVDHRWLATIRYQDGASARELTLPVGTTRVCTSTAPTVVARCWGVRVDRLPDGSPAVPVVGEDLGIRPPLVTRKSDPDPACGGCW